MKVSASKKLFCVIFSLVCILCLSLPFLRPGRLSARASDVGGIATGSRYENQFCNLVKADKYFEQEGLNDFGDDTETVYMGGSPLFDESTGEATYRYDYVTAKFPEKPWMNLTCDKDYPDCMTDYPSMIGDGSCDEQWNSSECGFDGGDCL